MSFAGISRCAADASAPCFVGRYRSRFAVAGITVEVQGGDSQAADLGPQLLPFATDADRVDIELQIEWSSHLRSFRRRQLFHSGCLWSVHEFGEGFLFDFATARFGHQAYKRLQVDENFKRGQILLNRECLTAEDASRALEYPLDELLITHYLSLGRGVELHACGLMRDDGESFLFVGHSGAGKSTTTRLWAEHAAVNVLSDDRIIVRRGSTGMSAKSDGQEGRSCTFLPHSFFMHGTPWHGEAAFASPERAPVRRIFLLEHGASNRIERISGSAAVAELLARSFTPFYQPRFVDPVLALLEEMVKSLPCYRFHFVPDSNAVERILEFRD